MLETNQPAPDFTLYDQKGHAHTLSNYKGQWVLMFFYPKDNTPGCTKEACGIRDNYAQYKQHDVVVLGISTDSIKSHLKFVEKFDLPFTLLADVDKEVVELYKVWGKKKFMGKEYMGTNRMSFLINPKGQIVKIYEKVKPADHAEEVLADINEFTS
jgi:peroxiredoxin Q/BCP